MGYIIGIVVVLCLALIVIYNGLVQARQRVREAWSTVETQLKRRYDLIPNLIEVVKGYAKHEKATLEKVVQARNMAMATKGLSTQKEQQENALSSTLKSIFALSENYPQLKANENFVELQRELADTETKIQASRQFYNTTVLSLNTKIQVFPNNLIAGRFGFKTEPFFELEEGEKAAAKKAPKVKFD